MMRNGRDATKRNRNIGTDKQGHGQDNRLVIPQSTRTDKVYGERLTRYRTARIYFRGHGLPVIVEQTRKNTCHACTVEDLQHVLAQVPYAALSDIAFVLSRWSRSLDPDDAKEFARLREDGHEIEETKREYIIRDVATFIRNNFSKKTAPSPKFYGRPAFSIPHSQFLYSGHLY